jgi:hypothetical protein
MLHRHHCPNCQKDWECSNLNCEKYVAYLCQQCYEIFPSPYDKGKHTGASEHEDKNKPDSPKE